MLEDGAVFSRQSRLETSPHPAFVVPCGLSFPLSREDGSQADTSRGLGISSPSSTGVVMAKPLTSLLTTFKCNCIFVKTSLLWLKPVTPSLHSCFWLLSCCQEVQDRQGSKHHPESHRISEGDTVPPPLVTFSRNLRL